jgi:predicted Zn-dependent protease
MAKLIKHAVITTAISALALHGAHVAAQSGVRSISASDKAQGAKAHPELLKQFGGPYDGPQADYVRRVGQKIAVQSGLSNAQGDFTVTLLNSSINNAFAIPGGYVYVTRQLLGLMNNEAELASVMGHEVGHVAARHSNARNRTSTIGSIGSLIIGVVTGSQAIGQIAGLVGQVVTLKFSRQQEYEADDLGIAYLAKGGYDPMASSTMLASLAAQSALDARVSNQQQRSVPTWASTHPDPASRVARAAQNAVKTGIKGGALNAPAFLTAVNGVMFDDDPAQGTIEGQTFRHRDLKLLFTVPNGYGMQNGSDAVAISGSAGQGQFKGASFDGNLREFVSTAFKAQGTDISVDPSTISMSRVNGLDAATATSRQNTQSGPVDLTIFAYAFDSKTAYFFVVMMAAGQGATAFSPMFQSMRRLSQAEADAIRPRKIDVVTVGKSDTVATLAARMAYASFKAERFTTLNALGPDAVLRPGQKVKIVIFG